MKTRHSYIAICVTAALYAPQVLSEPSQSAQAPSNTNSNPVEGISDIYSDMDMRIRLAAKPDAQACSGDACIQNQAFDAQVQAIGARLAQTAYATYPDLKKRVPIFTFGVADKKVLGSASNAKGTVILFRGIQYLDLGEEGTSFLLAREMGHVIASHHKSNAKTKILFSVLAGVLFPAVSILSASSAATQATTATSVLTSAASTATSFVGSEVALSRVKPSQISEADDISIALLQHEGLSKADIAQSLEFISENASATGWEKDLYQSIHYVRALANDPKEATTEVAELEPLPDAMIVVEASVDVPVKAAAQTEKVPHVEQATQAAQPTQKPAEQHQVILITNQTIAENHKNKEVGEKLSAVAPAKASVVKKDARKPSVNKKTVNKKAKVEKNKNKVMAKAKKKSSKEIKKTPSKSASKKSGASKRNAPIKAIVKLKPHKAKN